MINFANVAHTTNRQQVIIATTPVKGQSKTVINKILTKIGSYIATNDTRLLS
jgi:hypothetical protein